MLIQVDRTGSVDALNRALQTVLENPSTEGVMILACDANQFEAASIDPILAELDLPVFGGIFPELIINTDKLTEGSIVVGVPVRPDVHIIPGLSDMDADYDELIYEGFQEFDDTETLFVYVDGLSTRISDLIDGLFNNFGLEINYIGGGAGSLSFEQRPCLFTNQGLLQDCALLTKIKIESGIGVSHGWQTVSGPIKVTDVDRNVIKTLDWRPAFEVYREVVEAASGQTFNDENFFDIAKGFPFGINKLDSERIVRDPIVCQPDGSLVCVGQVPEESYVSILCGDTDSLVNAASNAYSLGRAAYTGDTKPGTILFIDCISRVLFLEEEFGKELDAVYDGSTPMIGALTLGEIANSGNDYLEFYNKTAVVGVLGA